MENKENNELEKLKGEVYAQRTICLALIATHRDKEELLRVLARMTEQTTANALQTTLIDTALQTAQNILGRVLLGAQPTPHQAPD